VTLTVTDDDGATDAVTHDVTTVAAADVFARDAFGRTVSNGWGTADVGGAWSTVGTGVFSVDGSVGKLTQDAGRTLVTYLGGVQRSDTEVSLTASLEKPQTGGGTYLSVIGRRISATTDYRANIRFQATGIVTAKLSAISGGTETIMVQSATKLMDYTAGQKVRIRLEVSGTSPTTVRLKVWPDGTAEPATWQLSTTNSLAALQAAGSVGISPYVSGTFTGGPSVVNIDDFDARVPGA